MKHSSLTAKIIDCAPEILEGQPVLFAYLYGSHAAGDAHAGSDVDIAVFLADSAVDKPMRIESIIALAFDDALGHTVDTDVRSMNEAPLVLQGEVATKGVLLYSCDERARVEFETRVRMAYFDFQPTIKAYQEAYIAGILNE